jgi:hypothetical protein
MARSGRQTVIFTGVRATGVSMVGALATLAVSCTAGPVQAATGLEEGVHADPGSPAAKQYALPLNHARQTGGAPKAHEEAHKEAHEGSSASVPFGAGIHPSGQGGSSHPRPGANGGHAPARHAVRSPAPTTASRTGVTVPSIVLHSARSHASSGGGSSLPALLGGALAILVLGGLGGMLIRRSSKSVHPV